MKEIRVLIIDDETIAREVIKELIAQLTTGVTVVGVAKDGSEAIEQITALKPDLVFMDLDMPLINGYEVIERLSYRSFYLVFTTGYTTETMKTTNGMVTSSLSKPIDPAEFLATIEKVRQYLSAPSSNNLKE
ncbi:MAG TPA: response regulator [Flavisolibacter sp.]|jgi:two-component system LytT family response regulator|nr:response regulator [Flavisolibacter sp.]